MKEKININNVTYKQYKSAMEFLDDFEYEHKVKHLSSKDKEGYINDDYILEIEARNEYIIHNRIAHNEYMDSLKTYLFNSEVCEDRVKQLEDKCKKADELVNTIHCECLAFCGSLEDLI